MFEKMRERWTKAINPLVHRMEGVDPSLLTWTSLILSILAFYLLMTAGNDTNGAILIVGGVVVILVAGVLDGLDGALARHQGTDGPYGDFLDHTIDRVVDVGILVAIGMNAAFVDNVRLWISGWPPHPIRFLHGHSGSIGRSRQNLWGILESRQDGANSSCTGSGRMAGALGGSRNRNVRSPLVRRMGATGEQ